MRTWLACSLAFAVSPSLPWQSLAAQVPPAPVVVPGTPAVRMVPAGTTSAPMRTIVLEQDPAKAAAAAAAAAAAGTPPNPADPATAAATAAASLRVQKWKQLQFDRRPSTILQAWSLPELKPYDPAEEKAKEEKAAKDKGTAPAAPPSAPPAAVVVTEETPSKAEIERMLVEQFGQGTPVGTNGATPPAVATATPPNAGAPADAAAAAAAAAAEAQLAEKKLQREVEMLQRDVTLGRWQKVGEFLLTLPEKERKGCYEHFLKALPNHPQKQEEQRVPQNLQEKNRFAFEDTLALAGLAPGGVDKKQIAMLAPFVQRAIEVGSVLEELVRLLSVEQQKPAGEQRLDRRESALLLATIGQDLEIGPFLPTAEEAEKGNDREGLNLLARHALAMHAKEKKNVWLETAWQVTQAALAKGDIGEDEKKEALRRAVELAPKVHQDLGPAWLADSFTTRPERGMEIIATIGGQVAKGFQEKPADTAYRANGLRLQKTAVEALLKTAPQLAEQWRPTLGLLASGWIVEASYSYTNSKSDMFGPMMERDEFGNIFWTNRRMGGGGQIAAIEPVDLVEAQPGSAWAALLDDALEPHFTTVSAQLFLKVNEPEKAFPFIEQLAATNARKAKDLAHEFLRVWMRNHNPNANNSRTNSYMFMYGFEQRANGIPLTRSKQERNLDDLANWVVRLRKLPIGGVDEKLLGEAFTSAHSTAEVYRLETIERVFGDVSSLDPVLLGELLGKMRTNLATVWRRPAVQEQEKTKRTQREMLEEVARGYGTALTVAQKALLKRGRHWALLAVVGSILHDQNNFSKELQRNSNFAETRKGAFELFAQGAAHYAEVAGGLRLDEETIRPWDTWFYAALGASDLGAVDEETVLAKSQLPLIRAAIDALPQASRERHLGMFANQLFTRMSAVKPQIKYRYLEAGFAVIGDHPQAIEARKVWDYYQDLIRELKLETSVEGSTAVGTKPFGVRIDIVHSPEIERESGGFQKYATNQNNQSYAWNYGRPLENYRDKFQEAVSASLQEHFEVLSVTFNGEAMASKPTAASGWRSTPYAWLLLKARGPQVDRIPELKLDFDFLDTSGFTILPVASSPVAIDASAKPEERPFTNLHVTQLLDERRADEGKITLEIKAKSNGLVPDLESILQLDLPGFVVDKRDDQGASVMKFSDEQDGIESERVWLLALKSADADKRPASFVFGKPREAGYKAVFQRYDDADLQTVSPEVALSGMRAAGTPVWVWVLLGVAFAGYMGWFFVQSPSRGGGMSATGMLQMPQHVTPFTVLALLQHIAGKARLDDASKQALAADIERIEACHFGRATDPSLDLAAIAKTWLARAL
jgi:hypothetical protein